MEETIGEKISTDFFFLADKLPEEKRKDFLEYRKYILNFPGVRLDSFHIGFFNENIEIAKIILKDKIVIDVGCGFGFQHILYQEYRGWIGIQYFLPFNATQGEPELRVFTDNAKIIKGKFIDVWDKLGINEENSSQYFGIANHSLWNDPKSNEKDIIVFKKLFKKNGYATSQDQIIKYEA